MTGAEIGGEVYLFGTGEFRAPLLASLTNVSLLSLGGAQLTLPSLTEFVFESDCENRTLIDASGVDAEGVTSRVSLPALESLSFLPTCGTSFTVAAYGGGVVELPGLSAVLLSAEAVSGIFSAYGGTIDLSVLDPIPDRVVLQEDGGGVIFNPNAKSIWKSLSAIGPQPFGSISMALGKRIGLNSSE
jgi:hypothetical protein